MDIIGKLPLEIGQKIICFLPVREIGKCLGVSKQWRTITNDNLIWKNICIQHDIENVDNVDDSEDPFELCRWAKLWREFTDTSTYRWCYNCYNTLELNHGADYAICASHGRTLACYSDIRNFIDIYIIGRHNYKLVSSVEVEFLSWFENIEVNMFMNDNYIAIGKNNMIIVLKKMNTNDADCNFELFKAFSIQIGNVLVQNRNFIDFFSTYQRDSSPSTIDILTIIGDKLWFSFYPNPTYVVDITAGLTAVVFMYDAFYVSGDNLLSWNQEELRVYDGKTGLTIVFVIEEGIEDVSCNEEHLLVSRGTAIESIVDVWNFTKGQKILTKILPTCTWNVLHPKEDLLFSLEALRETGIYRLNVWSLFNDHLPLWSLERHNEVFVHCVSLNTVGNHHVMFNPTANNKNGYYFIKTKTGKLIYEEKLLEGAQESFGEQFCLARRPEKFIIRSYV